jgi:aminopeptidase-like protein
VSAPEGGELYELAREIFPFPRSLTGNGVRQTLAAVGRFAPLETVEVPSGTGVYDWVVPPEWNVREAWIADGDGRRIVDVADSSLHLVGYSEPVRARLSGRELDAHLHSLPDRPDAIPYRTSYFERTWGFCLADRARSSLDPDGSYDVLVDSTLDDNGSLTYGEARIPGSDGAAEILVSTYVCHPSLANDNVAGIVVAAGLGRRLEPGRLRHDVRIVFTPSGVGTLCFLHRNEGLLDRIQAGLVVACAGDPGPLSYKRSRRGSADVDRAAALVVRRRGGSVREFVPWGTDERQYCSPGFDLPVGVLNRTPNGGYDAYHTSDDDLDLISAESLADSLDALEEIVRAVDANRRPVRIDGRGEPQLSRHAIEGAMTGDLLAGADARKEALFWTLNLADGRHDLLDVAERTDVPFAVVDETASALERAGLVRSDG